MPVRAGSGGEALDELFGGEDDEYLGGPVQLSSEHTTVVLDARVLALPVLSTDAELSGYFQDKLHAYAQFEPDEPELINRVRTAIQHALATGKPTTDRVAR